MKRIDYLFRLASQRREYAADALRCEAEADKADGAVAGDAAGLWRDRADCWWRLVAEAAAEYQLVKSRRRVKRRPSVLPFPPPGVPSGASRA